MAVESRSYRFLAADVGTRPAVKEYVKVVA